MDLKHLFEHPDQYILAFDGSDAVFVEMDRDAYHRSIFFDQGISPKDGKLTKVGYVELCEYRDQHFSQPPKLGYIFHMAHYGSTLLDIPEELINPLTDETTNLMTPA